jgi:hypothetical protein
MLLCEYVEQNWTIIKMRYGQVNDWENAHTSGTQTNFPRLWHKGKRCRLYIPASPGEDAGYIDLTSRSKRTYSFL